MVPLWTSRVTPDKGFRPQFWDTVYITEVNGTRKVKSDAKISMDKNSDPSKFFFLGDSIFFKLLELSKMSRARLIFKLQLNIDKANSRRYDVTQ